MSLPGGRVRRALVQSMSSGGASGSSAAALATSSSVMASRRAASVSSLRRSASSLDTRVICFLFSGIGFPRADDSAVGTAPGVGDGEDPALDLAQADNAGFAVVEAAVDGFDRGPVK